MRIGGRVSIIIIVLMLLFTSVWGPVYAINIKSTENESSDGDSNNPEQGNINNLEIFVNIKEIKSYDDPDPWPWAKEADFKIKVIIDGEDYWKSFNSDDNHIFPGWVASHELDKNKKNVEISLKLLDRDPDEDDVCDIDPNDGDKICEITYNTETDKWTGDDGGTGRSRGYQTPECEIRFDVWHTGGDDPSDEFKVDAQGPYEGDTYENIELKAIASGGKPPYIKWNWIIYKNGKEFITASKQNTIVTFVEAGIYDALVRVRDQDNKYAEDWTTITITNNNDEREKYAVIIAGGNGDLLDDVFKNSAKHAYTTFKDLGYTDDQIYWLSGRGKYSLADGKTTYSNVKESITGWLKDKSNKNSDCFIYLTDHGDKALWGSIHVHPGKSASIFSLVLPFVLDNWVDKLEYHTCTIVIDGCHSGHYIDYCSGKNRIVMTSTDYNVAYGTMEEGCFTEPFFNELEKGSSYGEAWEAADKWIDYRSDGVQNALIDDNGDSKGHGTDDPDILPIGGDGYLALRTYP